MKHLINRGPFVFKILVGFAILSLSGQAPAVEIEPVSLEIAGHASKHGMYDPSVEYDDKGNGWLAYSSLNMPGVETHLAKTSDRGKTWTDVGVVNKTIKQTLKVDEGTIEGWWRNETATLVYTPDDPGREWKLFWHKYFVKKPYKGQDRVFPYGWIAYKYASDPAGEWSKEVPLFGSSEYPAKPYTAEVDLTKVHKDLLPYVVYTEPGSMYHDGVLYVTLEGSTNKTAMNDWATRKVVLLASYDQAKTWEYLGALTDSDDAKSLDFTILTAAAIFEDKGKLYMMATPAGSLKKKEKKPEGSYVFEFADISKAKLKRDKKNRLKIRNYLKFADDKADSSGHGDYHSENTTGGVVLGLTKKPSMFSMFSKNKPKPFQIVITGEKLIN